VSERAVRRLARRLAPETVEHLCVVMMADAMGRPPRRAGVPATVRKLRATARKLRVADAAPKPVLLGRHLIRVGIQSGPEMGRWLEAAFEAQLEGAFHDLRGAAAWLAQQAEFPPEAAARLPELAASPPDTEPPDAVRAASGRPREGA